MIVVNSVAWSALTRPSAARLILSTMLVVAVYWLAICLSFSVDFLLGNSELLFSVDNVLLHLLRWHRHDLLNRVHRIHYKGHFFEHIVDQRLINTCSGFHIVNNINEGIKLPVKDISDRQSRLQSILRPFVISKHIVYLVCSKLTSVNGRQNISHFTLLAGVVMLKLTHQAVSGQFNNINFFLIYVLILQRRKKRINMLLVISQLINCIIPIRDWSRTIALHA